MSAAWRHQHGGMAKRENNQRHRPAASSRKAAAASRYQISMAMKRNRRNGEKKIKYVKWRKISIESDTINNQKIIYQWQKNEKALSMPAKRMKTSIIMKEENRSLSSGGKASPIAKLLWWIMCGVISAESVGINQQQRLAHSAANSDGKARNKLIIIS